MAGIGFRLRGILERDTYAATLQAYFYAGLISAGPWVLSIISVLVIGIISVKVVQPTLMVAQYLVSVTYLMAGSLIFTGGLQLMFTRFISDRLFEEQDDIILPNLCGAITLVTCLAAVVASLFMLLFDSVSVLYRLLMVVSFVTMTNLWIVVIFLSGMKEYDRILITMAIAYAAMIGFAYYLRDYSLEGLLASFLLAHALLLFAFLYDIVRQFPSPGFLRFDFLDREKAYYSLFCTGLLYYLGIWVDKFLFWMNPMTSEQIIGPLTASVIYDIPIFLAYLSIIPGMAVFLVRIETDFAEHYENLYDAIRGGEALDHIYFLKDQMVFSIRQGIHEVFKVQGLTVLIIFMLGPSILSFLDISHYYLHLLYVNVVGVSVQVVLMSIMNVYFYLDRRNICMGLNLLFFFSNLVLTSVSHILGPSFYGYGFTLSMIITAILAMIILNRVLRDLEYETFMLHK